MVSIKRPSVVWGLAILGALLLLALAAPLIAPYDPTQQLDPVAGGHLPPGSRMTAVELEDGRWLLADEARSTPEGLRIERLGKTQVVAAQQVEDRLFLLGTDRYGRDLWSRLVYGARVSLTIGVLASILALTLGVAVGGLASVVGGPVDSILMRVVEGFLAFPRLFLVLVLSALFGAGTWVVILVLAGTGWMASSRLVRAEILSLRQQDFVVAAQAVGQHPVKIFWRHLLPSALTPTLVDTALRVGDIILIEAALSFLGLGIQPPLASWGNMIADGSDAMITAWWVTVFPGLAIALTVVSLNLIGDGLRDTLDPRFTQGEDAHIRFRV